MAFLGKPRTFWWRKYPLFALLDALFITALFGGIALLFVSRPAGFIVLLIGTPLLWFARNAYIRPIGYRELGLDPALFVPEVIEERDHWGYFGVGAWTSQRGTEPVKVLLNPEGKYMFETADGYLYGQNVGGVQLTVVVNTGLLGVGPVLL